LKRVPAQANVRALLDGFFFSGPYVREGRRAVTNCQSSTEKSLAEIAGPGALAAAEKAIEGRLEQPSSTLISRRSDEVVDMQVPAARAGDRREK